MSKVTKRVEEFLEDRDNGIWFQMLCEYGTQAIEAQAWQVAAEVNADKDEARDAMLELAYALLPDSPTGSEDPRQVLFRELGVWATGQSQAVQDRLAISLEDSFFQEAWESGLNGFRHYLRRACETAIRPAA